MHGKLWYGNKLLISITQFLMNQNYCSDCVLFIVKGNKQFILIAYIVNNE